MKRGSRTRVRHTKVTVSIIGIVIGIVSNIRNSIYIINVIDLNGHLGIDPVQVVMWVWEVVELLD